VKSCFIQLVLCFVQAGRWPGWIGRPRLPRVAERRCHRIAQRDHHARGAVILIEWKDMCLGILFCEVDEQAWIDTVPRVNGLAGVDDDREISVAIDNMLQQPELGSRRILKFVVVIRHDG
jgi:hypothetical protein